jgi:hypothetical protein
MHDPHGTADNHERTIRALELEGVRSFMAKNSAKRELIIARYGDLVWQTATGPRLDDERLRTQGVRWSRSGRHRAILGATVVALVLSGHQNQASPRSKADAYRFIDRCLRNCGGPQKPDLSQRSLIRAFDEWEPVLHLHLVPLVLQDAWRVLWQDQDGLARFLNLGESIRVAAQGLRLDHGPLVDPTVTWRAPRRYGLPLGGGVILPGPDEIERGLRAAFA